VIDDAGGWHKSYGSTGWQNATYGGGFYMIDASWIRTWGNKSFYHNTGTMRTDGTFQVGGSGGTLNVINGGTFAYRTNVIFANTAGNVGIGTAAPTEKLHVVGRLKTNGINETSDVRYKKNIQPLTNSLEKVLAMRGVNYEWKTTQYPELGFADGLQLGVIAQEVENIVPEVVHEDQDGYKSVEYSHLTPLLIEAIKELHAENKALQSQNKTLQSQNSELNDKISILTTDVAQYQIHTQMELEEMKKMLGLTPAVAEKK